MANTNSILTPTKLVNWKRKKNIYNFTSLPKKVIITPNSTIPSLFQKLRLKKLQGINGTNYILNNSVFISKNIGVGAPNLVNHIEELCALGVEEFVFIGFAGIINNKVNQNTPYIVKNAYSLNGITPFYSETNFIQNEFSDAESFNLEEATVVSTDALFRETPELVDEYKQKKVELIDMEAASFLMITNHYQLKNTCVLIASDKIENNQWVPPNSIADLLKTVDTIIRQLISKSNA